MIEWKKYDETNPPELDKYFLVANDVGGVTAAELNLTAEDKYMWFEIVQGIPLDGITHYAEINSPDMEEQGK